jgi:hypothetical protein
VPADLVPGEAVDAVQLVAAGRLDPGDAALRGPASRCGPPRSRRGDPVPSPPVAPVPPLRAGEAAPASILAG